ncbi:MAG: aerial mycelium formation protein [Acidimicrobiales bacterium]
MVELPQVTDPGFLDGLETWTLEEVRATRDDLTAIETGLSYLRRVVQSRLDIALAEHHRREMGEPAGATAIVERLPEILGSKLRSSGTGRLNTSFVPTRVPEDLDRQLEAILPASRVSAVSGLSDGDLIQAQESLTDLERLVSAERRRVFEVIDRLQDEVVRRYKTGEATVDSLLA